MRSLALAWILLTSSALSYSEEVPPASPVPVQAVPAASASLDDVQSLHSQGQHQEALEKLDATRLKSEAPALYYYNRGVLLHSLSQFGLAVASFEKARVLAPHRPEVDAALESSRSELARIIGPARLDAASWTLEKLGDEIPFDPFVVFFGGLALLGGLVLLVQKRPWDSRLAILTYVILAFFISALGWRHWMRTHPAAMVSEAVSVKSGPGQDYLDLGNLESGMKIRVLHPGNDWWKIRFDSEGSEGFVPRQTLLLLAE